MTANSFAEANENSTAFLSPFTVVGKGTTDQGWGMVQQEAEVYRILRPVQGSAVPVFLGAVHPNRAYFYEGIQIKHFLLFSWSGDKFGWTNWTRRHWDAFNQTLQKIRGLGVDPGKVNRSSVVWDSQRRNARLVCFDHANSPRKRVHAT